MTWRELSNEEFHALAESPEGRAIANRYHLGIYGSGEHHSLHSCPCAHQAVQQLLNEPGLHNAPGVWRWEERESGWWRVHDELNIEDGPHQLDARERALAENKRRSEVMTRSGLRLGAGSPHATFSECPQCGAALTPEHAHYRCTACGWRDSCCD